MLSLTRSVRSLVIALGLGSLAFVLFPNNTEPLWNWAKSVASAVGKDPLPSFGETQRWSGLGLAGFVLCGIVYNLWRDRRYRTLQAEYACQTGAKHLKEKVADLEAQVRKASQERDKWQESYMALTRQHAAALIASKEHEVRSEYGKADRETLGELRKEFDTLVRDKGHIEGFREAMQFFLAHVSEPENRPQVSVEPLPNGSSRTQPGQEKRAALPFTVPPRT